ncbi:hypothetical protein FO519_001145 [Halicephalobus sp. NKZ332]|nr:hypothetical protein FO519_001145 [Halicephalobus sp. NKZ332]
MAYIKMEPEYTDDRFVNGAKQAISLVAKALREDDNELLSSTSLKAFSTTLMDRVKELPREVVQRRMSFEKENIVHACIHSCVISSNKAFNVELDGMTYFGTVIAVIDPKSTEQVSLATALKRASSDVLICNITVCRQLRPLGIWKISHVNFFTQT